MGFSLSHIHIAYIGKYCHARLGILYIYIKAVNNLNIGFPFYFRYVDIVLCTRRIGYKIY